MVFPALLVLMLASLGSCSRLPEQDQLQPSSESSAALEMDVVSDSTSNATAEIIGDRCCCFFPYTDEYVADFDPRINVDSCPSVGCAKPHNGKYWSPCSKVFLRKDDVYCAVTSIVGCNGLLSGLKEKIDEKWMECYGKKRGPIVSDFDCIHKAIKLN
mmetsp:Transcript_59883/g.110899  ORF Transcript_59883/g.110899 Transcript_59883/m.110899 type:complete len:158 (+) Transcript_59883:71-544(+)